MPRAPALKRARRCAQVRSEGSVEPLNSAALPPGGLRQDHHGFEHVPLQPADSLPYHAYLEAADPTVNTTATGLIQLQVAPDNSSVVRARAHRSERVAEVTKKKEEKPKPHE